MGSCDIGPCSKQVMVRGSRYLQGIHRVRRSGDEDWRSLPSSSGVCAFVSLAGTLGLLRNAASAGVSSIIRRMVMDGALDIGSWSSVKSLDLQEST